MILLARVILGGCTFGLAVWLRSEEEMLGFWTLLGASLVMAALMLSSKD